MNQFMNNQNIRLNIIKKKLYESILEISLLLVNNIIIESDL